MKGENVNMNGIIVGLDIGTTKVSAVIGRQNENGITEVRGVGVSRSYGLKNGIVNNIDNTAESIRHAIDAAEMMAGDDVEAVYVGISGQHVAGQAAKGVVAITNRAKTITNTEVRRVIEQAQAIVMPSDREILHILSREFSVDDQRGIKDPIGMSGIRLEADVHIITGLTSNIQNIIKAVEKSGLQYEGIVFSPLAASDTILGLDEKDLGVALVDIGGGTTDIIIYFEGGVIHSSVLPVGGIHVTNDISFGIKTPLESAEEIKNKYGCAVLDLVDPSDMIDAPSVGGRAPRRLYRQELTQIIEPRMTEIMEMIDRELIKCGKKDFLGAGVVLTGGTAMMEGVIEAAEKVFNLPVRVGVPGESKELAGLKDKVAAPQFTSAVGLLEYGCKMNLFREKNPARKKRESFFGRMKKWFDDYM